MDNSPLGHLPPELRNRVYTFALSQEKTITLTPQPPIHRRGLMRPLIEEHRPPPGFALLGTCRQTRAECSTMFYALNDFAVIRDVFTLKEFTKMIGKRNAEALRSVTIKDFSTIKTGLAPPAQADLRPRYELRAMAKLAKHYAWSSAKVEVKFESFGMVEEVTVDVANRGEFLNDIMWQMDKKVATSTTLEMWKFLRLQQIEFVAWRRQLLKC